MLPASPSMAAARCFTTTKDDEVSIQKGLHAALRQAASGHSVVTYQVLTA